MKTPAFSEQTEADDTAGDHCDARGGEDDDDATRRVGRSVGRDVPIIGTSLDAAAMDRTRGT